MAKAQAKITVHNDNGKLTTSCEQSEINGRWICTKCGTNTPKPYTCKNEAAKD